MPLPFNELMVCVKYVNEISCAYCVLPFFSESAERCEFLELQHHLCFVGHRMNIHGDLDV